MAECGVPALCANPTATADEYHRAADTVGGWCLPAAVFTFMSFSMEVIKNIYIRIYIIICDCYNSHGCDLRGKTIVIVDQLTLTSTLLPTSATARYW